MDIKSFKICLLFSLAIIISSCDPFPEDQYYILKNDSPEDITAVFYSFLDTITSSEYNISTSNKINLFTNSTRSPEVFGAISAFDSVVLSLSENDKKLRWTRPAQFGFIDIGAGIGEERDNLPKDIYNRDNWQYNIIGSSVEWIFIINEEDLTLFE